jgi:hypothetical protein
MSINFTCQACDNNISMEDEWAGQRVTCPQCRETVPVPGGRSESAVPASGAPRSAGAGSMQPKSQTAGPYAAGPGNTSTVVTTGNKYAKAGFIVALISGPTYFIGVIPLCAIILSWIGLATFDAEKHKDKWMAGWGLGIGILFMLMNIAFWRGWLEG